MKVYDSAGQLKVIQAGGITNVRVSAGTTSNLLSAITFADSNGISFGINASTLTAQHNALTSQSNQAFSAAGGSSAFQTLSFNNANGASFSNNAGAVELSYSVPSTAGLLSNIRVSAGTTSNLLSAITFDNANGISFGLNASTITGSVATSLTNIRLSAGTTSNLRSDFTFSNLNGVTFGLDNGTITASVAAGGGDAIRGIAAGGSTASTSTVHFSNSNGISFGFGAGANSTVITGSHNAITSQTNQTGGIYVTAQSTGQSSSSTYDLRTLSIVPDGIISAGWSAGSFRISATQSNQAFSADASSTFQTLTFQNSNLISFSNNAGAIRITHDLMASTSRPAFSAQGGSSTFQTLLFNNANGVGWTNNTGAIEINSIGMSMFATGNTTLSSTGTSNLNSVIFRGSGAASVGITNGSVLIDVAAGAAAITQSIGISTQTAGGATAGTSGYATGDDILYHFAPGSNITMSQSLNGASATLSIYGPAAGGFTYSGYNPYDGLELVSHAGANASLYVEHHALPAVQFDRVGLWLSHSNASNSSGSATLSAWLGIYTRNNSSLSLVSSTSATIPYTGSGTAGSYSQFGGIKIWAVPWTVTLGASNYWIGRVTRSTTGGANMTFGGMGVSQVASTWSGYLGSGSAATAHRWIGQGVYSVTTAGMPAAISITQINANSSLMHRQPAYAFLSDIF